MNVAMPQLSVAVGAVHVATWAHVVGLPPLDVRLIFDGQPAITGKILSVTVNVVVQLDEFPAASVTVSVTFVTPVVTVVPAAGDCTIVNPADPEQLSETVNVDLKSGTVAEQELFANADCAGEQALIIGAD